MALITCPECGKDVSEQAAACPSCGFPLEKHLKETLRAEKREALKQKLSPEHFSQKGLERAIADKNGEAAACLKDEAAFDRLVQKMEQILKRVPRIGAYAGDVACMVSLARSYIRKEYGEIPLSTIIGIVSALLYIVSPVDLVPDGIPFVGFADDLAALLFALEMAGPDLEAYRAWRRETGRALDSGE